MTIARRTVFGIGMALLMAPVAMAQSPAPSPDDGGLDSAGILPMGRLVFASDRGGDNERIWMLEAGASEPVRLTVGRGDDPTSDNSNDRWPDLSPDGTTLVFASDRDNPHGLSFRGSSWRVFDLYIVTDGAEPHKLLRNGASNHDPVWSPDAQTIAFSSEVKTDGCKRERGMLGLDPRTGLECATRQVFTMDAVGSNVVQLTDDPLYATSPAWSPDGSRIAFSTLRHDEDPDDDVLRQEIYVMNADGSEVVRLTDDPASDGGPDWSPDGELIAFHSDRNGGSDIYVMNADGSNVVRLTDDPGEAYSPAWSPDGTMIAFVSQRDGDAEIYIMNADGTAQSNVSRNPWVSHDQRGADWSPRWER